MGRLICGTAMALLLSVSAFAQKWQAEAETRRLSWADTAKAVQQFTHIPMGVESSEEEVLQSALQALGYSHLALSDFHLNYVKSSPIGRHLEWTYQLNRVTAFAHFVKVYQDASGAIRQVAGLLEGAKTPALEQFNFPQHLGFNESETRKTWFFTGNAWKAAWVLRAPSSLIAMAEERIVDQNGATLHRIPLAFRYAAPDTLVPAAVFLPDPLTSAGVAYGEKKNGFTYLDYNDADSSGANQERKTILLKVKLRNDTFLLYDTNFYFAELEGPVRSEPRAMFPIFQYTRNQEQFEFVNIFYHLTQMKGRVDSLGIDLPGFPIQVDAHASNGLDISAFSLSTTPPSLLFGDGGIDDGEDADVIVHEFGHSLSYGAAPNSVNGLERSSFEEGQCDYFAMSYSRHVKDTMWEKTFNWDGNQTWQGRVANSKKILPDNLTTNIYSNAEIWVSALSEVYDSVGRDVADMLVITGLYQQFNNMSFRQMALSLIQTDSVLYQGKHDQALRTAFNRRRILFPLGVEDIGDNGLNWTVYNSIGFAQGEAMQVYFGGGLISGTYTLYAVNGQQIRSGTFTQQNALTLSGSDLKKGLYILKIEGTGRELFVTRLAR